VAAGELQGGEEGLVPLLGSLLLEFGEELAEVRADLLGRQGAQMGADELQRERVIGQIAQQRIELVAAQPGIGEGETVAPQDAREEPQAVGTGQAFELVPLRAGSSGLVRIAEPTGSSRPACPGLKP
jgi:hypothetical protein